LTFARRKIDVTFRLGQGSFGEDGFDEVKLSGHRAQANVTTGDGVTSAELALRIYGIPDEVMKKLTILNQDYAQRLGKRINYVTVEAGDEGGSMSIVFTGGISEGWADFSDPPGGSFIVMATTALVDRYRMTEPTSFSGPVDAAIVMQTIASKMQRRFENNGVSVALSSAYFYGSAYDQMQDCRRAGDFNAMIDPQNGNLVIWPRNEARRAQIPLISKDTGMVGYPAFTQFGVKATTLYNPALASGGKCHIDSTVPSATGDWYVYLVGHDLEAETPGGKWFTHFEGSISKEQRPYV